MDIDVYAYNSSNNPISLGSNDNAWYDPVSFTASSNGTVYVRVRAYGGDYDTGTYAIVYNTSGTKPASLCTITFDSNYGSGTVPSPVMALSGTSITLPNGSGLSYYSGYIFGGWFDSHTNINYDAGSSYPVTRTTTLYANWIYEETFTVSFDLNGVSGTTPVSQTGKKDTTIELPNGNGLSNDDYTLSGWTDYYGNTYSAGSYYTINGNITLYAKWLSNASGGEGNPIRLTADIWIDGSIDYNTYNREVWYSFSVTSGTTYYVWWNDYNGDGSYSFDIKVDAYNSNGSLDFSEDAGWDPSYQIVASSTGTVKLKVSPFDSNGTGDFAIAYSTSSTRP